MPLRLLAFSFLALAAPLAAAQAQPTSADAADQQEHVLEIRDGRLLLDGRALPSSHLPRGLDLSGIEMTYNYAGPVTPVIELDGVVYVLEGAHLKRLDETDRADAQVYFLGEPAPEEAEASAGGRAATADAAPQATEAAYLEQLSTRDEGLYDQIQREQALEAETLRLADRIRRSANPAEKAQLTARLRALLDESFELKQDIRAGEIAQAEAQIGELRRLLGERAARKSQIIEHRIEELTGGQ